MGSNRGFTNSPVNLINPGQAAPARKLWIDPIYSLNRPPLLPSLFAEWLTYGATAPLIIGFKDQKKEKTMQRRKFFRALFGGIGAAIASRHVLAGDSTVLIQESPIAGFQFHRGNAIWPSLCVGEKLSLVRESFNEHDRDAVAVYFNNEKLGFVPRQENRAIAQMLDRGENLEARIASAMDEEDPWRRIGISIFLV